MNTRYWNTFMGTGKVEDYLTYRGIVICEEVMERYRSAADGDTEEITGEPDNSNGDGAFCHPDRRI